MGIASGIFWIMAGLLYILYQAFKEHPAETLSGVVICAIVIGCVVGFTLLSRWLMDVNLVLGSVFTFGVLGYGCYRLAKFQHKERQKKLKMDDEYNIWMEKVRNSMTEKDYEDYARENCWRYYANMDVKSVVYWKNEPYYSKIKWAAEIKRSCELRHEEELKKLADNHLVNS